jgi:hypothetical protein
MRVRPDGPWTLRFLASVIDNLDQPSELKHIMVHLVYDGQVMARVFDSSPQHAQVQVVSTTRLSVNSTYDVVVTWEGLLKRLRVYVDGNLEGTTTANVTRSVPTSSPLYLVHPTSISAHKLFAAAWDNRAWTAAEVEALNWSTTPPPPPPPPGVLRVLIDGAEHPGATVEIDGVPVLPEGTADKVVTVSTVR